MRNYYAGVISIAAPLVVASFLLLVSPWQSLAQRGGPGATAAGRRIDTLNRQGEQYERDSLGREPEGPADAPQRRRRAQDLASQVKRDFEGLQAGYNKIVLAASSGRALDLDSVINTVAEVRKCAARLRDNLALPRSKDDEGDKPRGGAGRGIEETLLTLRKHIFSFVTNPTFEAPAVINVEQARKAGRDLDMILELSEGFRRSSGRPKWQPD